MPCNALNHRPDCNCGWGGEYHEGSRLESTDWSLGDSHVNPNARCPKCQQKVFFYRSPEGGAVYFDRLGPPWPKHPCMDSNGEEVQDKTTKVGWWPFLCDEMIPLPKNEGVGIWDAQERGMFIKCAYRRMSRNTPIWMRSLPGQPGRYEVSTLSTKKGKTSEVVFKAFGLNSLRDPDVAAMFPESIAVLVRNAS